MMDPWKLENIRKSFEVGSPLAQGAALHKLQEMANEIAKLREENERLREALKPFRKVAEYLFERNYGASDIVLDMTLERKGKGIFLRAGDFFPVAAALKEPTP